MASRDFEIIVRGVIVKDGKILVCQTEGRDYFFLPGGHVEFAENTQDALVRELQEETGIVPSKNSFIGVVENIFMQEGVQNHEVNFVFEVEMEEDVKEAAEDHLTFYWFTPKELRNKKFVPPVLLDSLIKWTENKKPFFVLAEVENGVEY